MTESKPKRRWFRFSIRDLLLVTAIAALAVGWWLDHRIQVDRYRSMLPPKIVAYPITTADPNAVLKTLQTAVGSLPDVTVFLDTKTNTIVAQGRPGEQETILAIILKLERQNVHPQ